MADNPSRSEFSNASEFVARSAVVALRAPTGRLPRSWDGPFRLLAGHLDSLSCTSHNIEGKGVEGCPEDVNGDGVVDINDVVAVINAFGPCYQP